MKKLIVGFAALVLTAGIAPAKKRTLRELMDHYFEIVDGKAFDRFAEIDAADLVMKVPLGTVRGVEGHQTMSRGFAAAMPNYKHTIGSCIESGDRISCEGTFGGDQTGPLTLPTGQVVPPTGKHVEFEWSGHARLKDGKVAEMHVYFDPGVMMQQLGLVPSAPKTAVR